MSRLSKLRTATYAPLGEWAYQEITTLRTQLAATQQELMEVTKERDAVKCLMDCYNLGGWTDSIGVAEQLLATQAKLLESEIHAARLKEALEAIAKSSMDEGGCYYTNRGNIRVAKEALSTPINLDALHEHDGKVLDDAANVAALSSEVAANAIRVMAEAYRSRCSTASAVAKEK